MVQRAVLNLESLTPPTHPQSSLLYMVVASPLSSSPPNCNPPIRFTPPPPPQCSPSWVLSKPTARRSFESNSPDVSFLLIAAQR